MTVGVRETWTWRARCSCGSKGSAESSDLAMVQSIAEKWRDQHSCVFARSGEHAPDCAVAQFGFAKCTCDDPEERRRGNPTALPVL